MKAFTESDRYVIKGLGPDSLVLDIGGYEGNWARQVVEKYRCHAHIFEPIEAFFEQIGNALMRHPLRAHFTVHNLGIGGTTREEKFGVRGDTSGLVADGPIETVALVGIADLLNNSLFAGKQIGCIKINAEASEFEILEALLEHGLMPRVETLHVQFHNVIPRAAERMAYIKNMLRMTHRPIWDADWVWCGWEIK